jgi:hypothetical protein
MRFRSLLSSAALFGEKLREDTPAYFSSQRKEGLLLMGLF